MDKGLSQTFYEHAMQTQRALYIAGLHNPDLSALRSVTDFPVFREKLKIAHEQLQPIIGEVYEALELDEAKIESAIVNLEHGSRLFTAQQRADNNFSHIARAVFFSAQILERFPPTDEIAFKGYAVGLAGLISDLYHCSIAFERSGYVQKFFEPETASGSQPEPT